MGAAADGTATASPPRKDLDQLVEHVQRSQRALLGQFRYGDNAARDGRFSGRSASQTYGARKRRDQVR
jgi:hypothetical protein